MGNKSIVGEVRGRIIVGAGITESRETIKSNLSNLVTDQIAWIKRKRK